MPRSRTSALRTLADHWAAPSESPAGDVGRPLICVATTYTFHASFLESELLPRFLGLKFDDTEGDRPFVVEREQALATSRACVLVDADHFDLSQSTLRWDQLPVRVPRGVQHSKVVVLIWENYARLMVSSANITRSGYRRNREIAGVIDFYDHEASAPRRLLFDALSFLRELSGWVRASNSANARYREALDNARVRVRSWQKIPHDFAPRERPRATFVGGLPEKNGGVALSPLKQLVDVWGTRRASEITVMTPFVGDLSGTVDPVVQQLLEVPRTRNATGYLIVPGQPSEREVERMVVGLPRRFIEAWCSAWHVQRSEVSTHVVPLCRDGEKVNRDLHAKGILISGEETVTLLCGSSNFSPHGMGVAVANAEANICYVDDLGAKRDGLWLEDRLPVNWEKDYCEDPIWPDTAEPIGDEDPGNSRPLPAVFLWAVYDQRSAVLTVSVNPSERFPAEWSLHLPGNSSKDVPPLLDQGSHLKPPVDGLISVPLPESLHGANIAGLPVTWRDEDGAIQIATLPVHVESGEQLLPPDEFRSLTADGILECLLSGRDAAEWVEALKRRNSAEKGGGQGDVDSLRSIDTSSYVLYRTRRFGAALANLGDRLLRTVRTRDAITYRLRQDPLGPRMLAEALVHEWREHSSKHDSTERDPSAVLFSIAEINLMLAHAARRIAEQRLRPLFCEVINEIDSMCLEITSASALPSNLVQYLGAVRGKYQELLGSKAGGGHHAD